MILEALTPELDAELGIVRKWWGVEKLKPLKLESTLTTGRIGTCGNKTHAFVTQYIELRGKKYFYGCYTTCGSQSYKSGAGSTFNTDLSGVTCSKCLKQLTKK